MNEYLVGETFEIGVDNCFEVKRPIEKKITKVSRLVTYPSISNYFRVNFIILYFGKTILKRKLHGFVYHKLQKQPSGLSI